MKRLPVVRMSRGYRSQFSFNLRHTLLAGAPPKDQVSHAHDYELHVHVEGPVDPQSGFVMDAGKLKAIVTERVVNRLDGADANQFLDNPTSENLVVYIWKLLQPVLPLLKRLELWETSRVCFTYSGEEVAVEDD